jgi:hypothetical protein
MNSFDTGNSINFIRNKCFSVPPLTAKRIVKVGGDKPNRIDDAREPASAGNQALYIIKSFDRPIILSEATNQLFTFIIL